MPGCTEEHIGIIMLTACILYIPREIVTDIAKCNVCVCVCVCKLHGVELRTPQCICMYMYRVQMNYDV